MPVSNVLTQRYLGPTYALKHLRPMVAILQVRRIKLGRVVRHRPQLRLHRQRSRNAAADRLLVHDGDGADAHWWEGAQVLLLVQRRVGDARVLMLRVAVWLRWVLIFLGLVVAWCLVHLQVGCEFLLHFALLNQIAVVLLVFVLLALWLLWLCLIIWAAWVRLGRWVTPMWALLLAMIVLEDWTDVSELRRFGHLYCVKDFARVCCLVHHSVVSELQNIDWRIL